MICIRIMGGLGNQMYQYAMGRSLSLRTSSPLAMEMAWFDYNGMRGYVLDKYRIAPAEQIWLRGAEWERFLAEMFQDAQVKDREDGFDPEIFAKAEAMGNLYLKGYWQSYRYFEDIRDTLQKEFTLKEPLSDNSEHWMEDIERHPQSVFLHVRRGDYVKNSANRDLFAALPISYYEQGVQLLAERFENLTAYIFSNDMPWVKKYLKLPIPMKFVEGNDEEHGYEDLELMRVCRHHIIANSTFSWWGAWLSEKGGWTIGPDEWFKNDAAVFSQTDFYPEDWKAISYR